MLIAEITRGVGLISLLVIAVPLHFYVAFHEPPNALLGAAALDEGGTRRLHGEPSTLRLVMAMLATSLALVSGFVAVGHAPELHRRLAAALAAASLFAGSVLARHTASTWRTVAVSVCLGVVAGLIWF